MTPEEVIAVFQRVFPNTRATWDLDKHAITFPGLAVYTPSRNCLEWTAPDKPDHAVCQTTSIDQVLGWLCYVHLHTVNKLCEKASIFLNPKKFLPDGFQRNLGDCIRSMHDIALPREQLLKSEYLDVSQWARDTSRVARWFVKYHFSSSAFFILVLERDTFLYKAQMRTVWSPDFSHPVRNLIEDIVPVEHHIARDLCETETTAQELSMRWIGKLILDWVHKRSLP